MINVVDEVDRNPLHYATTNKFTNCGACIQYMMQYGIEIQGWD